MAGQTLTSPFNSTSYGPWNTLASVKQTGTGQTTSFQYDSSGDLTQMNTPFGGYLRWAYGNGSYTGGILQREVQNRYLVKASGSPETAYPIARSSGLATIDDPGGQGEKVWFFQTDTTQFNFGLLTAFSDRQMPGPVAKLRNDYTWVQDSAGNPYLGTTVTTLKNEPGQSVPIAKQTTQTLDAHGNVTQVKLWDYYTGTPPVNPARTYTNTYLTSDTCNYASLYIFNRLTQSTLTDGTKSTTLVTNQYGQTTPADASGIREHDANYNTGYVCRANLTSSTTPSGVITTNFDIAGNIAQRYVNGELTTNTVSSSTNYTVPTVMTTNSLTSSMSWTGSLAPSSATGPNGDTASINYDGIARQQSSVSPFGATTTYAYNDTAPATRTATTNGHWTRTTLDGFGRTTKTESGDAGGTKSTVDTGYDSCGCNPMGKMVKTSMPYAPNATVYWKTYSYDGLGRTVTVSEPDGTSATSYSYQGNTVQVTDPAGKWKKFTMDAFGNLTSVIEPDPVNQPSGTLTTTYAYDILNHLTTVTMPRATGTQTRAFNYTTGTTVGTLLLSATNPENGTVTYAYNTAKTLATKTDAKNQQFSYTYDSYKRVTQINQGGNLIRQFYYDTNPLDGSFSQNIAGRLAAVQNAPTINGDTFYEMYSYGQPGQVIKKRLRLSRSITYFTYQHATVNGDLDATYAYDNEGRMTSVTYPQSYYLDQNNQPQLSPVSTYTYGFDTLGRPTSMTGPGADNSGKPNNGKHRQQCPVRTLQRAPSDELFRRH